MLNHAMERALDSGLAVAVEDLVVEHAADSGPAFVGVYRLREYVDGVDYCVRATEEWILSIGRRPSDGAIFAATDGRFYLNPAFDCLFLR